jgi:hypothetical protein
MKPMKRAQALTIIASLLSLDLTTHLLLTTAHAAGETGEKPAEEKKTATPQEIAQGVTLPMVAFTNSSLENTVNFLSEKSNEILKAKGAAPLKFIITDPYKLAKPVTLYLSQPRLDDVCKQVSEQSGTTLSYTPEGIIFKAGPGGLTPPPSPATTNTQGADTSQKFARNLILPSIDFKDVSLEEAIDFLRLRSRELSAGQPASSVPNFIVMDPQKKAQPITLQLKNIPLEQACNRIGEMAGLRVKYDQAAIVFKAY